MFVQTSWRFASTSPRFARTYVMFAHNLIPATLQKILEKNKNRGCLKNKKNKKKF